MTDNETIKTIATLGARQDALDHRLSKIENLVGGLVTALHENTTAVSNLGIKFDKYTKMNEGDTDDTNKSIKRLGERIGEIEKKGSKKLEYIVGAIIMAGITALFMYFFGGDGL